MVSSLFHSSPRQINPTVQCKLKVSASRAWIVHVGEEHNQEKSITSFCQEDAAMHFNLRIFCLLPHDPLPNQTNPTARVQDELGGILG